METRQKIIFVLFLIIVFLIAVNILSDFLSSQSPVNTTVIKKKNEKFILSFSNFLSNYNVQLDPEVLYREKNVTVRIPEIFRPLSFYNNFENEVNFEGLDISLTENPDIFSSLLIVQNDSENPYRIEIVFTNKPIKTDTVSFLVYSEKLDIEKYIQVNEEIYFPFGLCIHIEQKEAEVLRKHLQKMNKEMYFYLDDNIKDEKIRIEKGFSKRRLNNAAAVIVKRYGGLTDYFLMHPNTEFLYDSNFSYFSDRISFYGSKLKNPKNFTHLNGENSKDLTEKMKLYLNNSSSIVFYIEYNKFTLLFDYLKQLSSKGYKFVKPKGLIN